MEKIRMHRTRGLRADSKNSISLEETHSKEWWGCWKGCINL